MSVICTAPKCQTTAGCTCSGRGWLGANTPVSNRVVYHPHVAADAADRRIATLSTMEQLFVRFDQTHELPFIVETESGRIVARFARDGDLAGFISKDGTIPTTLALQVKEATT